MYPITGDIPGDNCTRGYWKWEIYDRDILVARPC